MFLGGVVKKAAFAVPVVWTLSAQQAFAAGSKPSANPSCLDAGEPCTLDAECCSESCQMGFCAA
jgi:hypothetical protein